MSEQYQTIQHRWFNEVWNKRREEAIDEMLAPDVVGHGLVDANGNEVHSIDAFKQFYQNFRAAMPDLEVQVVDTISQGDQIAARCTVKARHTGESMGVAPTGNPVEFSGVCIVRVKDGKIAESWNYFDFVSMFQQMGMKELPAKRQQQL